MSCLLCPVLWTENIHGIIGTISLCQAKGRMHTSRPNGTQILCPHDLYAAHRKYKSQLANQSKPEIFNLIGCVHTRQPISDGCLVEATAAFENKSATRRSDCCAKYVFTTAQGWEDASVYCGES